MNKANQNDTLADALGYRAKIGVLVPATNTIVQPEFEAFRPKGVTNHVARMEPSSRGRAAGNMDAYRRSLERDSAHIKKAIDDVIQCEPQAVVLGHSIDTFRGGPAGAEGLLRDLERHAKGTPVILPSFAFLAALKALGAGRRLAALTPYWPPGDEQVATFFAEAGYNVVRILGLKCPSPLAIAATPGSRVMEALADLAGAKPDVIVQPGTNLATAALAPSASQRLGIPLISCNTATYWHALRSLDIDDKIPGFGPLMELH